MGMKIYDLELGEYIALRDYGQTRPSIIAFLPDYAYYLKI
jgi:hypothetical protein